MSIKSFLLQNVMKILSVGVTLPHADRRTEMRRMVMAFGNSFAQALRTCSDIFVPDSGLSHSTSNPRQGHPWKYFACPKGLPFLCRILPIIQNMVIFCYVYN